MILTNTNTVATPLSSTEVNALVYEAHLIRILSLPLSFRTRQLEVPQSARLPVEPCHTHGVDQNRPRITPSLETGTTLKSLKEVNWKLNVDTSLTSCENTYHNTFEAGLDLSPCYLDGELNSSCTKRLINLNFGEKTEKSASITPRITCSNTENIEEIAQLEDMPIAEQKKKGLLGLNFKIIKVINPESQRICTKYVCSHEG